MSAQIEFPLSRFVGVRGETSSLLAATSQAQLDARPAPGRWSAGEVFDHLILAEGIQRREIEGLITLALSGQPTTVYRSLAEFDVSVFFIPKAFLPFLSVPFSMASLFVPSAVRDVLARSRLLPAQNPTAAEPRRGRAKPELEADLAASLASTRELGRHPQLPYERLRLVHPLLGTNDVPGMLRFLANHEQRHQEQIREALAAVGSDPATTTSGRLELAPWREARRHTLGLIQGLSQQDADRRPAPGKWSPGEVLDHLLKTERYLASEMGELIERAASGRGKVLERSFADFDGRFFFLPRPVIRLLAGPLSLLHRLLPDSARRWVLASRRVPLQAPSFLEPTRGRLLAELVPELQEMAPLRQLEARVAAHPTLALGELLLIHPVFGRQQGLGLIPYGAVHEQRHQEQLREALWQLRRR